MTVISELCAVTRSWTGVETLFDTGFKALDATHVRVTAGDTVLVRGTHYTSQLSVSGILQVLPLGGMVAAPATLLIERNTPATQENNLVNGDTWDMEIFERELDGSAMRDAETRRKSDIAYTLATTAAAQIDDVLAGVQDGPVQSINGMGGVVELGPDDFGVGEATEDDFDTSATTTDIPITSPRIYRIIEARSGFIDPYRFRRDYGAVFDGTGTGANDRLALQAAIDYAENVKGELLLPKRAKINSSAGPLILKNNMSVYGRGRNSNYLGGDGTGSLFSLGGVENYYPFRGRVENFAYGNADYFMQVGYNTAEWYFRHLYGSDIKYVFRVVGRHDGALSSDFRDATHFWFEYNEAEALRAGGEFLYLRHCSEIFTRDNITPGPLANCSGMVIDSSVTSVRAIGDNFTGMHRSLMVRSLYGFPGGNPDGRDPIPREMWFEGQRYDSGPLGSIGALVECGFKLHFVSGWASGNLADAGGNGGEGMLFGNGTGQPIGGIRVIDMMANGNGKHAIRWLDNQGRIDFYLLGGDLSGNGSHNPGAYANVYMGANNSHWSIESRIHNQAQEGLSANAGRPIVIATGNDHYRVQGDIEPGTVGGIEDLSAGTATNRDMPSLSGAIQARTLVDEDRGELTAVTTIVSPSPAALVPYDDTQPQSSEGAEVLTLTWAAKDAGNILEFDIEIDVASSISGNWVIASLYRGSNASPLRSRAKFVATANAPQTLRLSFRATATTTVSTVYRVRLGCASAATLTVNGEAGGRKLGGAGASFIAIREMTP